MNKATFVGLALVLSSGIASAQPAKAPPPAPVPTGGGPTPIPKAPETPKTDEKAGTNETLQNSTTDARPWAQGVSPEKQTTALKHFQQGNKELNNGLFESAIKEYREALKDWEHPAIYYNLALALLKLDQPIEVYDSLEKALKYGEAPLEKDKFEHAQEYKQLVAQQIATVEVTCRKPGAKISVDSKEVFTVNATGSNGFYQGRIRIGKHSFVAEKPGYNAEFEAPFIGPGEVFRIELKLYTSEELTRRTRQWPNKRWVPYAVVGSAVVFAGAAIGLEAAASSGYSDYDSKVTRCNADSMGMGCSSSQVQGTKDSADTKKVLGYVGYGLAGGAVIAGLTLLYMNRETTYQITADEYKKELREKDKAKVSLTPVVAPDIAGAMISGSF
ncbi:MAG TPA: hypothetical protein VGM90_32700 [Kofleriaceae bacterium]|jgi:tetratricopeptide (TPR) repeat protein